MSRWRDELRNIVSDLWAPLSRKSSERSLIGTLTDEIPSNGISAVKRAMIRTRKSEVTSDDIHHIEGGGQKWKQLDYLDFAAESAAGYRSNAEIGSPVEAAGQWMCN